MQRSLFRRQISRSNREALTPSRGRVSVPIGSSADILPMPDLQIQQRPEQFLVILPPREMIAQNAVECARLVIRARQRSAALQMIHEIVAQVAAEPLVYRHAKPDLAPLHN